MTKYGQNKGYLYARKMNVMAQKEGQSYRKS